MPRTPTTPDPDPTRSPRRLGRPTTTVVLRVYGLTQETRP